MPIISKVEAKSVRGKILFAGMFAFLTVIGLTLIYPFAITIAGSLRSPMDQAEMDLVPKYLVDRDTLYRKYLECKYNQDIGKLNIARQESNFTFKTPAVPTPVSRQADDLAAFASEAKMPNHWQVLGGITGGKIAPETLRVLIDRLSARYNGDLAAFSRDAGTPPASWNRIVVTLPDWLSQRYDFQPNPIYEEYSKLLDEAALPDRQIVCVSGYFMDQVAFPVYGKTNIPAFNKAHPQGPTLTTWGDLVLPPTVPPKTNAKFRAEWTDFVTKSLHPSFVTLVNIPRKGFDEHLRVKYGDIKQLNTAWNAEHASFDDIQLPDGRSWLKGVSSQDYREFVLKQPVESWKLAAPEYAWRDWLTAKYKTVDALNAAHQTKYASIDVARLPVEQIEYPYAIANAAKLRWDYATRNYAVVFRELISQGRPFWNTIIVCAATVILTLLINPIAAYAMSRYQLPGTYKILLLLMVTAAFPPMVVLVPQFLILRESGMLNTYAALIIPFIASGYLIFLLKGFFDSLPHNLYEAALIDGCGEIRMFFTITMALSKPILAVVALQAFNSAYSMFLYPLIVCPRTDMWTLNVWLYQWQSAIGSPSAIFASLLIAAIPTLVIFLFAQNVIMRGIVVPVEK